MTYKRRRFRYHVAYAYYNKYDNIVNGYFTYINDRSYISKDNIDEFKQYVVNEFRHTMGPNMDINQITISSINKVGG